MANPSLATVADLELVLQQSIEGEARLAAAEFGLMAVSAAVRNYTGQYLSRVVADIITLDCRGGPLLFLPELPVISVSSVVENGVALVVTTDYKLIANGILVRRPAWWRWYADIQAITVTYTHGFDPIPDDIVAVVARAASRLYQAGLRAEDTEGILGVASKSLGDFSVSYAAEAGAAEGMMGASGARLLTLSEKELLNLYKL